ncbi:MAG: isoprenylcysteine carboxylmethyltransferase family protein [Chitinispirillia bacterium]|jgi:protein-S-isoprenylcysteine O-methyltransferase Ste14
MNISMIICIITLLIIRHTHHFWCIRHASRQVKKEGIISVIIWFLSYILLSACSLYSVFLTKATPYDIIGIIILLIAVIGRMISINQLGKAFSEFIYIGDRHHLVDTGIYSVVRHPLHYFLVLEMVSFAWIIGVLWAWIIIAFVFIILIFREIQEEEALLQAFGEKYRVYKKKTVALTDLLPIQLNKKINNNTYMKKDEIV